MMRIHYIYLNTSHLYRLLCYSIWMKYGQMFRDDTIHTACVTKKEVQKLRTLCKGQYTLFGYDFTGFFFLDL